MQRQFALVESATVRLLTDYYANLYMWTFTSSSNRSTKSACIYAKFHRHIFFLNLVHVMKNFTVEHAENSWSLNVYEVRLAVFFHHHRQSHPNGVFSFNLTKANTWHESMSELAHHAHLRILTSAEYELLPRWNLFSKNRFFLFNSKSSHIIFYAWTSYWWCWYEALVRSPYTPTDFFSVVISYVA